MTQGALPLALIVAMAEDRVIGRDNAMPWHLPADLRHFKRVTLGKPVIMGRKTWESLPFPLPGRLNLVVSRQPGLSLEGAEVFADLASARARAEAWAREQGQGEVMIIGGAQIYAQALPEASRLYITRIALSPEGDTRFPEWSATEWQRTAHEAHPAEGGAPAHAFETYQRV